MLKLVTGGSGSGKSAFAEELVTGSDYENRYYLATMQVYDDDGRRKVDRHRKMRQGKGFVTIEQPRDIAQGIPKDCQDAIGLLECMSNLVANEMFSEAGIMDEDMVVKKVSGDVEKLLGSYSQMVIVTNNIFEDGIDYDPGTRAYMRALGRINAHIAAMADQVYEVVVGIPIRIK